MTSLTYAKAEPIALKNHPEYTEEWLKQKIIDDDYWLTEKLVPFYTYEHSKK